MSINNTNCCVFGCSSKKGRTSNLSFHKFPQKNETRVYITNKLGIREKVDRQRVWITNLKMGKPVTKYMKVCALHFQKDDFILPDIPTKKPRLKSMAVPTQNLPQQSVLSKKSLPRKYTERKLGNIRTEQQQFCETSEETIETIQSVRDAENLAEHDAIQGLLNLGPQKLDKQVQVSSGDITTSFECMITTDTELNTMTGIPNLILFKKITQNCEDIFGKVSNKNKLRMEERILLTMMKLKNGFTYAVLSILFKTVTPITCRRIFHETVVMLAKVLSPVIYWPSTEEIKLNMPICFKNFQKTRIVVDCTEIPVQRAKSLKCRIRTYSNYKKKHTIKFMTAVTPAGLITFVSKGYGGRCSDKAIFEQSGLMEKLDMYMDEIMVDKGFLIQNVADNYGIKVIQPPFLKKQKQFSKQQALQNQKIAKARVHIERVNQRIKVFGIFNKPLPVSLWPRVDDIFNIACAMVNLSKSILDDSRF